MEEEIYYTTFDCDSFALGYRATWIPDGECFTTIEYTYNWVNPKFNTETQEWYNDATPEQEATYQASLQATYVPDNASRAVNTAIITPQTDIQLNSLYDRQNNGFTLYCPKIKTAYVKTTESGISSWYNFNINKNTI